jgi:hypothetical protein
MKATLSITLTYDDAPGPDRTSIESQLLSAARHLNDQGLLTGTDDSLQLTWVTTNVSFP